MNELDFQRKRVRQELQDSLQAVESVNKEGEVSEGLELVAALRLFILGKSVKRYIEAVQATFEEKKDD